MERYAVAPAARRPCWWGLDSQSRASSRIPGAVRLVQRSSPSEVARSLPASQHVHQGTRSFPPDQPDTVPRRGLNSPSTGRVPDRVHGTLKESLGVVSGYWWGPTIDQRSFGHLLAPRLSTSFVLPRNAPHKRQGRGALTSVSGRTAGGASPQARPRPVRLMRMLGEIATTTAMHGSHAEKVHAIGWLTARDVRRARKESGSNPKGHSMNTTNRSPAFPH